MNTITISKISRGSYEVIIDDGGLSGRKEYQQRKVFFVENLLGLIHFISRFLLEWR